MHISSATDWIEWTGGECPLARSAIVHVRFRRGAEGHAPAGRLDWRHGIPCHGYDGDDDIVAYFPVEPTQRDQSVEEALAVDILAELATARAKFPGPNVTFAALIEEVGELARATFQESRERVRAEAVQVAVMAMRMVLDGDRTFDGWRKNKGLDALVSATSPKGCADV
jgi:hypothetical protein